MKADLDRLMELNEIDALFTLPTEHEDPYRAYLSNSAHFSGMVVKKRGEPPVLIAQEMERDEAAKSGLPVYTYEDFGYSQLLKEHRESYTAFRVAWLRRIFETLGVRGKVSVFGMGDLNATFHVLTALASDLRSMIELVPGEERNTIFDKAYETKDANEIAILRDVAQRTSAVMRDTRAWIASHRANGNMVIQDEGTPLTIGDVKRYVRGRLFEQNLSDPEGMIFAQGRDAAVPHSKGDDDALLTLGQTIVFDLFPRDASGYFHDVTRTWCIGHADPKIQRDWETVKDAHARAIELCKPGVVTSRVQNMVCEYFEEFNHPTVLNTPGTTDGYVHSLAHGLGLNVHEAPYFPNYSDRYTLQPGNVFTIEPGLYYPDAGYGIRIEDTVYLNDSGDIDILTDCPYDLVIELKG
jgi:Xaa-Pro aminopeptidase